MNFKIHLKILKVLVKDFKIDGNKRYDNETLKGLIKENINKELDYDALLNVTTIILKYLSIKLINIFLTQHVFINI